MKADEKSIAPHIVSEPVLQPEDRIEQSGVVAVDLQEGVQTHSLAPSERQLEQD